LIRLHLKLSPFLKKNMILVKFLYRNKDTPADTRALSFCGRTIDASIISAVISIKSNDRKRDLAMRQTKKIVNATLA